MNVITLNRRFCSDVVPQIKRSQPYNALLPYKEVMEAGDEGLIFLAKAIVERAWEPTLVQFTPADKGLDLHLIGISELSAADIQEVLREALAGWDVRYG